MTFVQYLQRLSVNMLTEREISTLLFFYDIFNISHFTEQSAEKSWSVKYRTAHKMQNTLES